MAGRITLLILMTGLFAAVWSSDHPPRKTVEPVVPTPYQHSDSVRETTLRRWPISSYERVVDTSEHWVPELSGTPAAETISRDSHSPADIQMLPLIARLLAGKWIEAGLKFQAESAELHDPSSRTIPQSNRISSQPALDRSSQR